MYPIIIIMLKDLFVLLCIPLVAGLISNAASKKEQFLPGNDNVFTLQE